MARSAGTENQLPLVFGPGSEAPNEGDLHLTIGGDDQKRLNSG